MSQDLEELEVPEDGTNWPFWIVGGLIYLALTILFGWQTWTFVNFLFPSDQLLMKALTLISFDVMSVFWGCMDLFYKFASEGAKRWVRWSWIITFVLSSIASVLYLVIQSMFRFHIVIDPTTVNIGYIFSIIALMFNIIALVLWVYLEYATRHPRKDSIAYYKAMKPQKKRKAGKPVQQQQASFAQQASAPASPKATAPLPTQASQPGQANGHAKTEAQ